MADIRDRPIHQLHVQAHLGPQPGQNISYPGQKDYHATGSCPSASQAVAVVTLLPVSGTLLALAGLTLVGTLIGSVVTAPLFVIFIPVLVPATFLMALAVTMFLASGVFGVTGLSLLLWVVNALREAAQRQLSEQVDHTKKRMADVAAYVGQKTKETGQTIQQKAHESGARTTTKLAIALEIMIM